MKKPFLIVSILLSLCAIVATVAVYATLGTGKAFVITALLSVIVTALLSLTLCITAVVFSKKKQVAVGKINRSLSSALGGKYIPVGVEEVDDERVENLVRYLKETKVESRKMNYVLDAISQSIIALDGANVVKLINSTACKLLSRDGSCVGRDLYIALGAGEFYDKIMRRLRRGGGSFDYKMNDKYLVVDVIRTEASDYGEITNVIIITDVSAQRLAARQRTDFFSNAGHELKTPLTSIQGHTELLLSVAEEGSPAKKYASRIHKEVTRLHSLILDMLKLSSIENSKWGAIENAHVSVSLKEVCQEVLASLEAETQKRELTVSLTGNGNVMADPRNVYEIVNNLCSNAVHYNVEKGFVKVDITESDKTVTLTVEDGGIGIAKEHIPRLCERFYRVDKSRSKITGGTGLGLAIVKHVCALYEAKLDIESEEGKGTIVTVTFSK